MNYPNDDLTDPEFDTFLSNRGNYGLPVFVYIPMKDKSIFDYDIQQNQLQIAAVGYHKKLNKFYGLVLYPNGSKSHEKKLTKNGSETMIGSNGMILIILLIL